MENREGKNAPVVESIIEEMLNFSSTCLKLWSVGSLVIDISLNTLGLFGAESKETFHKNYEKLSPLYQPDGKPSKKTMHEWVAYTFEHGSASFDWLYKKMDGSHFDCQVSLFTGEYKGRAVVCAIITEVVKEDIPILPSPEHDRLHVMMDSAPIGCYFYNRKGDVIDCNQHVVDMFEMDSKGEMNRSKAEDKAPTHQPNGELSTEYGMRHFVQAITQGSSRFPYVAKTKSGKIFTCEVTFVRIKYQGDFAVVGYLRETRDDFETIRKSSAERTATLRMQLIVDNMPIGCNFLDRNGKITYCNQAAAVLYGFKARQEYIERFGEFMLEYQPNGKTTIETGVAHTKTAFETGFSRIEWAHGKPNGSIVHIDSTLIRAKWQGEYILINFMRDLTDFYKYKKSELAMRQRLKAMLDASPTVCALFEEDGSIVDVNEAAVGMFSVPDKNVYLSRFYELSPKFQPNGMLSREKVKQILRKTFAEGHLQFEWLHQNLDGEPIPCMIYTKRVNIDDRDVAIAYIQDLREQMEQARIRSEMEAERQAVKMAETFMNAAPFGIILLDGEFNFVSCNIQALDMCKVDDDYEGSLSDFMPQTQPDGIFSESKLNHHARIALTGGMSQCEFTWLTGDGELLPSETTYVRIKNNDSFMIACYVADLRRIKAAEALTRQLEIKLREQEMNEKLQEEKHRITIAEESSRAKSRFLARMSHEIRTPITAVLGISEIQLQKSNLTPEIEESFAKIFSSSNILLGIINDILDLSRIESGKMQLKLAEYDSANIISDITHLHLAYLGDKDIKFRLEVDENLPVTMVGDDLRIVQIVNNLLSNAFKYTESGTVELSLRSKKTADNYVTLEIIIRDTGLGMTMEQLDELFSDYTRFHETEHRLIGGTGLGVPIVASLVEMMNAHIDIRSAVGKGTTVSVSIPQKAVGSEVLGSNLAKSLTRFETDARAIAKKMKFTPEKMPYGNVLVVDDVDANLYVTQGLLEFYGIKVETCSGGHDAINKINEGKVYDIIFLDQMMPGINGTETLKIIRTLGYTEPVVALTANALIGQAEEFVKNGFDGFISKPIQTMHLNTILTKFIRDKQPPDVLEAARLESFSGDFENFQSSSNLMEKLLPDFVKKYRNIMTEIRDTIESGDLETAHRLAHSLKGVAGLIQENSLSKAAWSIEEPLRESQLPEEKMLLNLENELKYVLKKISNNEQLSNKEKELSTAGKINKEDAVKLFDKLEPLLESRNVECTTLLDELRKIPEAAIVVRQIEDFDFSLAYKNMTALRAVYDCT